MLSAIHKGNFVETIPEELQLFDKPTLMSAIRDALAIDINPLNQTTDFEILEFIIPPSEHYFSPPDLRLYLKCSIENLDNNDVFPLDEPDQNVTTTSTSSTTTTTITGSGGYQGKDPSDPDPMIANPSASREEMAAWINRETERARKNLPVASAVKTTVITTEAATAEPPASTTEIRLIKRRIEELEKNERLLQPPTNLVPNQDAVPTNAFFYMMFDRCDVELNGFPLDFGYKDYGYKGYFNTLLRQPKEMKKTILRNVMWFQEKPTLEEKDYNSKTIKFSGGALDRYKITRQGRTFELCGPIMNELFYQSQLLPPGIEIKIKLYRKNPEFYLLSNDPTPQFRVKVHEAKLMTRYLKLDPAVSSRLEAKLSSSPATYAIYNVTDVKSRQILPGMRAYSIDNFFGTERIPNRVVFALVSHEAYVGTYTTDPLYFRTFGLEEISLIIETQQTTHKIDQTNKNYLLLHSDILTVVGNKDCGINPCIKYDDLLRGMVIFPFDLTPNRDSSDIQLPKNRTARLELRFANNLLEPLELLAFVEYSKIFHINKHRVVSAERHD